MRAALIGLGVVVALVLVAVLVGPSFVDWNSQKALIQEEARKFTGRELEIDGNVNLSLLPSPTLSASGVRLANIEGGTAPAMVELEALQVEVALFPLLQGTLKVESVALVAPRILLEVLPDGRRNWDFDGGPATATPDAPAEPGTAPTTDNTTSPESAGEDAGTEQTTAASEAGGSDFTVQIDSFAIERGLLVYRDARSGQEERIEELEGEIVAESLQGPFAVDGEGKVRGLHSAIQLAVGKLQRAGATPVNAEINLPERNAKLGFSGTLSMDPDPVGLRGKIRGDGENLGAVVAALTGKPDGDLPPALANSFSIGAALSADQNAINLTDLEMLLGDASLTSTASVTLGPPMTGQVKISVPKLDLDSLLAAAQPVAPSTESEAKAENEAAADPAPTAEAETAAPPPAGSEAPTLLVIPNDVMGDLQIAVDTLVYNGQIASQVRVNASMSDGQITLNQALALLPGGSDLSLTGMVVNSSAGPQFDGRVEAASDNLRGVLTWLGGDVADIPPDRLRKMSFSGKLQGSEQQISLTEIDLRVDVTRLAGGVVVALRERPGFGIGLSVDSLNVDAYMPRPASMSASGGGESTAAAGGGDAASDTSDDAPTPAQEAGPVVAGGFLDSVDANLNLRVGALIYQEQSVKDVTVEGTLQKGLLTLRKAQVGDLAGSSVGYSGTLQGLDGDILADGTLEMRVADPVRLARLAGLESAEIARLGAFNLTSNLRGSPKNFGFNAKLAALGGRYAISGVARPLDPTPTFDVQIDAEHPDAGRLSEALTGEAVVPKGFGAVSLKGKIAGNPAALRLSELDGAIGPIGLKGSLALNSDGAALQPSDVNLDLAVKHANLAQLARDMGGPADLADDLGPIDVTGRVTSQGDTVQVEGLAGTIGPMSLNGRATASLAGSEPALTAFDANVHLRHASLGRLSQLLGGPAMGGDLGGVDLQAAVTGAGDRWDAKDVVGTLGPTRIKGTVSADLSGVRPRIGIGLATGEIPVSRILAAAGASTSSGGAGAAGSGTLSPRWSHEPLDLSGLRAVDADFRFGSQALVFDDLKINETTIMGNLVDGQLTLEKLTGTAYQGAIQVTGKADARNALAASFAVTAIEVQLGQLLKQQADLDRVSGPVSINASLTTRGNSEAELISALAGNGDLSGTLTVRAKAEEALGASLLGLLGEKVNEIEGVATATSSIFGAFAGAPSALSGTFTIENGVARTVDTRLRGRSATALTHGTADLPAWLLNSRTEVFRDGDGDTPYLTAAVSGRLDEPNVKVGGQPFQRKSKPTGTSGGSTTSGPAPSGPAPTGSAPTGTAEPAPSAEPEKIDPKDLLEGLLKKLGQ